MDNFNLHNAWKSLLSSTLLLFYGVNSLLEIDYKEINALIGGSKMKKKYKESDIFTLTFSATQNSWIASLLFSECFMAVG